MNRELALYDANLAARPQIVVLNKIDLPDVRRQVKRITGLLARRNIEVFPISAATGEGIDPLLEAIWRVLPKRGSST
jgi:GTP-binding protein